MPSYLSPGVYVEEVDRGSKPIEAVGTAVAAFVGFTEFGPPGSDGLQPVLVTSWGDFERKFGGFIPGAMLPHAVYGYFNNGGGNAYIVKVPHTQDGGSQPKAQLALTAGAKPDTEALSIEAIEPGANIEVVIEPAPAEGDDGGTDSFTLRVREDGRVVETYENLTFGKTKQNVETVVNSESTRISVKASTSGSISNADRIPAAGTYALSAPEPKTIDVNAPQFAGSEADRTGIGGLVIADDVTMVVVPDLVTAASRNGRLDLDMWKAVQTAMIGHCENAGNRMAILDSPPGMNAQEIKQWRSDVAMYDSKFAAMYYPWITVANPLYGRNGGSNGQPQQITIPPSGHMAGVWSRNDATRGVWKAPANEVIQGVLDVEYKITKGEQDILNPIGVNCIRPLGTRGIRVWGARTLASDPSWRYVNVRRLFNMVEDSILLGTQWVVFEPNDVALWERVKRTLTGFLRGLYREGALVGATESEAFYVKCDAELNPPESVDEGKLIVEVGIAPSKPAEFVIFRISQWQGGSAASE
jgi:uncharacterized protein